MAGRTPDPGGDRGDGSHDPDDRPSDPAPRAWMHPSELGARFDTPAAGTPAVPPPAPAEPAPTRGRAVMVLGLAAAGLLLLATGFAIGTRIARPGPSPVATSDARTLDAALSPLVAGAAPAAPVADATHTATVITSSGRMGAICVDGGVVTALEGIAASTTAPRVAASGSAQPATLTAADPVSGLAYLTGVTCPSGAMSMRGTDRPAAGTRVHVFARTAGATGVRTAAVRVVTGAGRVEGARSGTAIVRPAVDRSVLGAPVVSDAGALVGIVVGLGTDGAHVVPTSMARRVIAQLVAGDPVSAGWLGVRLDASGTVTELAERAPARTAGIEPGDTIYAIDGRRTADAEALLVDLQSRAPGDRVDVTIERGGRTIDLDVTLGRAPSDG